MQVYTYHRGYVDTVLTPIDSIRYYKYFLQSGMMSVDPQTGLVKNAHQQKYFLNVFYILSYPLKLI